MSGVLDLLRSLRRGDSARTTGAAQGPGPRVVVAVTAVQLALTFPMWVRRRKWTFTYVDDTTIRQRQSIDFRFPQPEQFGQLAPAPGDEILVPLWISNKTPLNDLDIFDEEGRTMSMRNQRENGEVAALGMLVPAVLAAHLARPGEHAFLARLLGGVRLLALGCGLCTLCVAALIGVGSIRVVQRAAVPDPTLCTVTSTIVRPAAPQTTSTSTTRSERIRRISCQPPLPPQPPTARASASAQLWADIAAWVATALASLLVVGFGRTLAADLRCRNREDHVEPLPQS